MAWDRNPASYSSCEHCELRGPLREGVQEVTSLSLWLKFQVSAISAFRALHALTSTWQRATFRWYRTRV
jgi:hypothetical protein